MPVGHPVLWLMLAAVAAPLLAEIPLGFRVPVVVLEVLLGIVIGPQVLGLVQFDGFVLAMFAFGMATTLFMAGMELDFGKIKGRPLSLAALGCGSTEGRALRSVSRLASGPYLRSIPRPLL